MKDLKIERRLRKGDELIYGYWLMSNQYVGEQQMQITYEFAAALTKLGIPMVDSKGWD